MMMVKYKKSFGKFFGKSFSYQSQQGITLFIALVALVVMSLAAVALIRSVDTNNAITGNLSFKQTANISSSYGFEGMADVLGPLPKTSANANMPARGYYATCNTFDATPASLLCDGANLTSEATWAAGGASALASGVGVDASGKDAYGNTIRYIIERMSIATGECAKETCIRVSDAKNACGQGTNPTCLVTSMVTPTYRVTVRVAGPKNTITYLQSFVS